MAARTRFPGVPFEIKGQVRLVPGLSLKQMKDNQAALLKFTELDSALKSGKGVNPFELVTAASELLYLAVSRNYEDLTPEDIDDEVDMNTFGRFMEAIMGGSGLKVVHEVPASGEGAASPT